MVNLDTPDRGQLEAVNDVGIDDLPRFARVERHRDPPAVEDVVAETRDALDAIPTLDGLEAGAEIGITAGSRGIHDMPVVLETVVETLQQRGYEPFVFPAMGSHGGATAEGQRETLESLGITAERLGCEIRSSMVVEQVGEDEAGQPVFAAEDALEADAVLLANRVKPHTDYVGDIESGLCKMAVVGLGKQRGADAMHNAALARGFHEVIPERARILFEKTPVVGGVAVVENANERAARIEGVPVDEIHDREPELLDEAESLLPTLPVESLDLLIVDEIGKEISGTGVDTNVVGTIDFHNQAELDTPSITRVYVRSLTEASHGNALGVGLADFAHEDLVADIDLADMYVNIATSGEPSRGQLPLIVPSDLTALLLAASTTGAADPKELRIARIRNTLEPDDLLVSEPVARELDGRDDVTVGALRPLEFDADGEFVDEM